MKYSKQLILILLLAVLTIASQANVKPARIFSSNMVLQKGIENTIWGWADKNEAVSISMNGKTVKAKAGKDGKWMAKLPAMEYGGPYTLSLKGKNTIELTNVMIGEVWICSGQSNMEFPVRRSNNAADEIAAANYPNIRLFTVQKKVSKTPLTDLEKGEWTVCSSQTIPDFSAVGYFFGRKLNQDLNVGNVCFRSASYVKVRYGRKEIRYSFPEAFVTGKLRLWGGYRGIGYSEKGQRMIQQRKQELQRLIDRFNEKKDFLNGKGK